MFMNCERENEILRVLYLNRRMTVKEIADAIYVSESSVRRDLAVLEEKGLLQRFHGGAMLEGNGAQTLRNSYAVRKLMFESEKKQIARKAASLIYQDHVIFLDSSTTCFHMLPFLLGLPDVTIITNSVEILHKAPSDNKPLVIGTGGTLNAKHRTMYGEEALSTVRKYFANICFISCGAYDGRGMASSLFKEENAVRRAMMEQSNATYLLCTSDKLGIRKAYPICSHEELKGIISTKPPTGIGIEKYIPAGA